MFHLENENRGLREQVAQQGAAPGLGGDMLHLGNEVKELRETLASVRETVQGEEVQVLATQLADASERLNAILAQIASAKLASDIPAILRAATPAPGPGPELAQL